MMTKSFGKTGMSELVSSLGWLEEEDASSQDGEESPEMRGHHGLTVGSRVHSCTEMGSEDMEEEEEEEEEEREEGAVGLGAFGSGSSSRLEDDVRPDVHDELSPRSRVGVHENVTVPRSLFGGVEKQTEEQKETEESSRDQEKLRKIKERYGVLFRVLVFMSSIVQVGGGNKTKKRTPFSL